MPFVALHYNASFSKINGDSWASIFLRCKYNWGSPWWLDLKNDTPSSIHIFWQCHFKPGVAVVTFLKSVLLILIQTCARPSILICSSEDTGSDYDNFTPVIDIILVKLFLAIAAQRKRHVRVIEFGNAFVNGNWNLESSKYVYPENNHDEKFMGLQKSLFGFRESEKIWYEFYSTELKRAVLAEI